MAMTEKFYRLLQALSRKTGNGAAKWTTGSRDDTYIWSGSSASVAILTKDNDGAAPYVVRLLDAEGRTIEDEDFDGSSDAFHMISELYQAARADALDISAAIDSLLDDLGD